MIALIVGVVVALAVLAGFGANYLDTRDNVHCPMCNTYAKPVHRRSA
jgi:hypothetical protein